MNQENYSNPRRIRSSVQWIGVAVVSALVGAGSTLAVTPMMYHHLSASGTNTPGVSSTTGASAPMSSTVNVNVSDAITQVVKKVEPDVVAVVNYTTSSNFLNQQSSSQASDIGSGVMIDKDSKYAYLVTNNHVVDGGSKVEIMLQSKKQVQAQVVGTDAYTDLAVLKVPVSNFANVQPVQFANSDNIQVGQPVIAIGTPMGLDFADTVTSGIVSGNQRMMPVEEPTSQQTLAYQSVIQTDAAINPGNSGGPLLNAAGQLIGINSSKIVQQNFEGMGFAIPANEVSNISTQIRQTGHATHPALGISGLDMNTIPQGYLPNVPVDYGIYVQGVTSNDAKSAGLKQGDVIIAVNGQTVQDTADLRTALFKLKPSQQVPITIYRGSSKKTLQVKVGEQSSVNTTDSQQGGGNGSSYGSGSGDGSGQDPFSGSNPYGW